MQINMNVRTYRTSNSTVWFSNFEFYEKLLGGVTLLRVTQNVTWTQPLLISSLKLKLKRNVKCNTNFKKVMWKFFRW